MSSNFSSSNLRLTFIVSKWPGLTLGTSLSQSVSLGHMKISFARIELTLDLRDGANSARTTETESGGRWSTKDNQDAATRR